MIHTVLLHVLNVCVHSLSLWNMYAKMSRWNITWSHLEIIVDIESKGFIPAWVSAVCHCFCPAVFCRNGGNAYSDIAVCFRPWCVKTQREFIDMNNETSAVIKDLPCFSIIKVTIFCEMWLYQKNMMSWTDNQIGWNYSHTALMKQISLHFQ